jgi:hypothetical protein
VEEASATALSMSDQAGIMKDMLSSFKIKQHSAQQNVSLQTAYSV